MEISKDPEDKESSSRDRCDKRPPFALKKAKGGFTALLALFAVMAVLLVATALTIAWQIFNRDSQRNEMDIVSDSTQLALSGCTFYYGDVKDKDSDGNPTGKLITDSSVLTHMNAYDAVMGRNDDTAIYVRMTITGEKVARGEDITITVYRDNTGDLEANSATDDVGLEYIKSDTGKHWTEGLVALYLSNVASMRFMQIGSANTEADANEVYKACKDETKWDKTWDYSQTQPAYSFFSAIPEAKGRETKRTGLTKSNSFTVTLSDYAKTTVNGITAAVFFMKLDYEQPLVEIYLNENYESLSGRLNQYVTENFIGDISLIEISDKTQQAGGN